MDDGEAQAGDHEAMKEGRIGAAVVTYYPDSDVLDNLRLLREQVQQIVVVDNTPAAAGVQTLREACHAPGIEIIENGENLGIAAALNQGVSRLRDEGCESVFLFDQDSTVTDGYIATMLQCLSGYGQEKQIAILVPRYVDRRFGTTLEAPAGRSGALEAATTSGSLMPMEVFAAAGFFAEELFIDGVDYEYSLRVRGRGYSIAECKDAILLHSPGSPTYHRIAGSKPFQVANYSPVRRYYQERNKIWVAKRYWRSFAGFCARQFLTSFKDLLKIVLAETSKWRKIQYFFRGVRHGLLGRTGRLDE